MLSTKRLREKGANMRSEKDIKIKRQRTYNHYCSRNLCKVGVKGCIFLSRRVDRSRKKLDHKASVKYLELTAETEKQCQRS